MTDRPYHHGDLRAALLAGAERALAARGPAALSLRELAREAGVSHAAPGRHFRDKSALLDALALNGFERLTSQLAAAAAEPGDTRDGLLALARVYVSFALRNAALLDLMYSRKHEPDAPEELTAAVGRLLDTMMGIITEGQRAGEITAGDPEVVAFTVAAALHGFAAFNSTTAPEEADALLPGVIDVLASGLLPR
ncbi:TetR/AcrR family transcriptional regulator [Nocardiopsis changdeensis]|uniref:TetR/AcrR family transcriptional regulator n=1 Tax=Nocardiopsis changdeensis TaxID=2831969 RepID=A0ABX8BQ80_9ACTN|nr:MULTISPECIES: TetR/AcrR family transcriptional regulator [Nocardiopsis]QUX23414.1 TetR/AcrR family transcriptional regulator [Nocardiopsis changdeensis]QYX39356.1 TetR/AcrR family transcriptional regulator [Nocardiopsis sp. MT53]